MKHAIIIRTKWFWPWQDDQEEAWLEEMSRQGLHLKRADLFAQYEFFSGQPQEYTYRLDFQDSLKPKNKDEYLRLFTDDGWEHLGQLGGWQYFRKPVGVDGEREIFTDNDSKIQKYNRYLTYLPILFPSYLLIFFLAFWGTYPEWVMQLLIAVILFFSAFTIVASVKISKRIKQLKML